jgi:predicted dehydrogenase
MRDKNGVIASIHSTATQWQHTFRIEITVKYALIELKGILSGTKSYGKESLRVIERLPKSSKGYKIRNQYYFSKDNSWSDEIDEFANIVLKRLPVKTGNIYDALKVMHMVDKIYRADKKGV